MATEPVEKQGVGGFRLLIVDDEDRLRDMLSRSALEIGFIPSIASTAEQALRILQAEAGAIDIALIDLNLPGMGGLELLAKVRQRWPHTQAVILTGFGSLDSAKQAIRLDAADFLTKPCSLGDLEVALSKARERRLAYLRGTAVAGQPKPPENAPNDSESPTSAPVGTSPAETGIATLEEIERRHILAALDRHGGNRASAAAELGISERTIYYKLEKYQRAPQ